MNVEQRLATAVLMQNCRGKTGREIIVTFRLSAVRRRGIEALRFPASWLLAFVAFVP
jgi:hypothetical protein